MFWPLTISSILPSKKRSVLFDESVAISLRYFIICSLLFFSSIKAHAGEAIEVNLGILEELAPSSPIDAYIPPPMFGASAKKMQPSPIWLDAEKVKISEAPPVPMRKPDSLDRGSSEYSEYTRIIDGTPSFNDQKMYLSPEEKISLRRSSVPKRTKQLESPVFKNSEVSPDINLEMSMLSQPTAFDILEKIDVKPVKAETLHNSKIYSISISYQSGKVAITEQTKMLLAKEILPKAAKGRSIVLNSYASVSKEGESTSRRLALARALGIRDYLVSHKIPAENIEIRPMGLDNKENDPILTPDSVDILILD